MANQIISSYLSDTSIPADTRRNIAKGLNSGDLSEDAAVHGISTKYGSKYGDTGPTLTPTPTPSSDPSPQSSSGGGWADKMSGGLGKAIGGAFHGAQNGGGLAGAAGEAVLAAPEIAQGINKMVTPNTPTLSSQEQQDVQDKAGIPKSAQVPTTPQMRAIKGLAESQYNPANIPGKAVEGIKEGAGKISNAGTQAGYAISGVGEHGEQLTPEQRVLTGGKALADVGTGAMEGVFAAPGAVINSVPGVSDVVNAGVGKLNEGSKAASDAFSKSMGIDPASEQGQIIAQHFQNLGQGLAAKVAHDTGGELARQAGLEDATKAGDISKVEKLTSQKPTFTGNIGANIVKGTEAFTKPAVEGAKQFGGTAAQGAQAFINPLLEHAQNFLSKHPDAEVPKVAEFAGSSTEPIPDTGKAGAPIETDVSKFKKTALRSGMKESHANLLASLPDNLKQNAVDYIKGGLEKLANPAKTGSLFDIPGKEIENFMSEAKKIKSQLGEKVSTSKEALADKIISPVDVKNIKKVFEGQMKKLNVKMAEDPITKAKILDHTDSDIGEAGGASALLDKIHQKLSKGQMSARDLEALTSKIDQATGLVKQSGYKGGTANTVLTNIKGAINDAVGQAHPEFGEANAQYAKFIKDYQDAYNASKVPLNNGKYVVKGAQVLRRVLGNADAKYTNALSAMENIAKNFGLKMPEDVLTKAHLADLAEKYTGSSQPQSLSGGVEAGTEAALKRAPGKIGEMVEGAKAAKQYFNPKEMTKENALRLVDMLQKSMKK